MNNTDISCILIASLSNPCDSKMLCFFMRFSRVLNLDIINTIDVNYLQAACSKFELLIPLRSRLFFFQLSLTIYLSIYSIQMFYRNSSRYGNKLCGYSSKRLVVIARLQCITFNNPNCDKRERKRWRKTVLLSSHWYLLESARKDSIMELCYQ